MVPSAPPTRSTPVSPSPCVAAVFVAPALMDALSLDLDATMAGMRDLVHPRAGGAAQRLGDD